METAIQFIDLARAAAGLATDLIRAFDNGDDLKVGDVLSDVSPSEMTKKIKDARAALKYRLP